MPATKIKAQMGMLSKAMGKNLQPSACAPGNSHYIARAPIVNTLGLPVSAMTSVDWLWQAAAEVDGAPGAGSLDVR